jgi:prolyl oligopeptidase
MDRVVNRDMEVRMARVPALAAAAFLLAAGAARGQAPDPYLWLEDVNGDKAMAWVKAENARTLDVLEADKRFAGLNAQALAIVQAQDRIPYPDLIGQDVYNFWQDADHVRGVWRRTSQDSYAEAAPSWRTVLDLDALSKTEKANWVWGGADCPPPNYRRCLIGLSDGGEDASTLREFDLASGKFVANGFVLPRSKQSAAWLDDDTLIVARDWGGGTMTTSGYPFVVKTLKRGQPLAAAQEVFRGQPSDVSVDPSVLHDAQGDVVALITRGVDFFHSETWWLTPTGPVRLALPAKVDIHGLFDGRLVFTADEAWTYSGVTYKAGSLLAETPAQLAAPGTSLDEPLIFEPGPRQTIDEVAVTAHTVTAAVYDNVQGSLLVFHKSPCAPGEPRYPHWQLCPPNRLPVPSNSSVGVASASDLDDTLYYGVDSFLAPPRLIEANALTGAHGEVKALADRFDASKDVVEQFQATAPDGVKIPYFVVRPHDMKLDGSNPTILYAYGGFQVSETPEYSGILGKLWLERGGVYVLANIRGGGEFGPAWHEAALKTKRQVAFDDFAAVAKDLIARGITSPRRLGIQGGSNGGLLMGVEFVQHPELWRAVDIQVPLLDMLRYEQIAAGASWVGEYGSVSVPEERAFLAKISPYQNLKAGVAYPEPLIWTTTKDDRVGPQHARKFAAMLKALGDPYLYYEVIEGGHGAGANQIESAHTEALEMTYFIRKLMD